MAVDRTAPAHQVASHEPAAFGSVLVTALAIGQLGTLSTAPIPVVPPPGVTAQESTPRLVTIAVGVAKSSATALAT